MCKYFMQNNCNNPNCTYSHDPEEKKRRLASRNEGGKGKGKSKGKGKDKNRRAQSADSKAGGTDSLQNQIKSLQRQSQFWCMKYLQGKCFDDKCPRAHLPQETVDKISTSRRALAAAPKVKARAKSAVK